MDLRYGQIRRETHHVLILWMFSGDTIPEKACDIPRASPIHADNQKCGSYNDYNRQHLVKQCKTPVTLTSASFKIDPGSKKI